MRTIALEEHYATPAFLSGPGSWHKSRPGLAEQLADLGDGRIAAMDEAGVDLAVLSLVRPAWSSWTRPRPCAGPQMQRRAGRGGARYPDRLAGFAALPISAPDAAADELQRAVRELGFLGAVINGHCQGVYLDDPFFEPCWPARRSSMSRSTCTPRSRRRPSSSPATAGFPTKSPSRSRRWVGAGTSTRPPTCCA